jgi:hypothetical protein
MRRRRRRRVITRISRVLSNNTFSIPADPSLARTSFQLARKIWRPAPLAPRPPSRPHRTAPAAFELENIFRFRHFFLFFFLLRNIRRKHACCVATRCAKPRCAHAVLHHAAECVREQSSAQRALARVQHGSASCRAAPEEESPLNTSLTTFLQS